MKIRYFLSIMLALQSITPMLGMSRVCNVIRNGKTLLPTLTNRTAPLFAKSLHIALPKRNIFIATANTKQIPQYNTLKASLLTAAAGLWGYNKINSMTVHAQEEQLKYSKEIHNLSLQFSISLKKDNLIEAQQLLFNMAKNLKENGDYIALAQHTNEFLIKAESALIHQVLQEKKENISKSIQLHVYRILMANGMTKSIQESENFTIPKPYFNLFSTVSKNDLTKKMYLDAIIQLESNIIADNTRNTPTIHNEILLIILGTIKAILNGEI